MPDKSLFKVGDYVQMRKGCSHGKLCGKVVQESRKTESGNAGLVWIDTTAGLIGVIEHRLKPVTREFAIENALGKAASDETAI